MSVLDAAARALDLSERLRARGRPDLADRLLGRAIAAVGDELARRDPVVRSMLDLDAALAVHAARFATSDAVAVPAAKSVNPKGAR